MNKLFTLLLLVFVFSYFSPVAEAAETGKVVVVKVQKKHRWHHRRWRHHRHRHHRKVIIIEHAPAR
jgi:hypothetical protein